MRLATVPYSTSKASLKQRFIHLTNYSVNKKADAYVKNQNTEVTVTGDNKKKGEEAKTGEQNQDDEEEAPESKLSLVQLKEEF